MAPEIPSWMHGIGDGGGYRAYKEDDSSKVAYAPVAQPFDFSANYGNVNLDEKHSVFFAKDTQA